MTTLFISQAVGILFIIIAASLFSERKMVMEIFKELFAHRVLTYIWGLITLVLSLMIVLTHTAWSEPEQIAVSLLGWYLLLESLAYIFLPQKQLAKLYKLLKSRMVYYTLALGFFIVGGFFFTIGFWTL